MTSASEVPTREDLLAVAEFSRVFDRADFSAGSWVSPETRDDGVIIIGWWASNETVSEWEAALYSRHIVDPESDYLSERNVDLVNRMMKDVTLLDRVQLPELRRVLTFLVRAERHTGGGWFEEAFTSGMAQAATRRLAELARQDDGSAT